MPFGPVHIGDLQIAKPVIQGGMGVGISLARLAGAVASCGGVGVIASASIGMREKLMPFDPCRANCEALSKEIQKAREIASGGILGVNIMVALKHYAQLVTTALESKIDVIISGAGLPFALPVLYREACDKAHALLHTKLIPIVSSARAARVIAKKWFSKASLYPDAFVLEGPKAGGHLGFEYEDIAKPEYQLENLLLSVKDAVREIEDKAGRAIPIFAAGGIYTGADIFNIMQLGATGVQMGTRFVATVECDADDAFKEMYINATEKDVCIIQSPVGLPGRVIRNQYVDVMYSGEKRPKKCVYDCIVTCDPATTPYCISSALINAHYGNLAHGFAFAGANVYRVNEIVPVRQLLATLEAEYLEAEKNSCSL